MYNFEFHITVENNLSLDFDLACQAMGAKAINILLPNAPNQVMSSMTSKLISLRDAVKLSDRQVSHLLGLGFEVVRAKVEVEPRYILDNPDTDFYYLEVHIPSKTKILNDFDLTSLKYDWHKSKNEFKKETTMLTFRTKNVIEMDDVKVTDFITMVDIGLVDKDVKFIVEFAVLDTKESLDDLWLGVKGSI